MAGLGLQRLDKLSILMKEQRLKYLAQSGGGGLGGGGGDQGCMTALYEHMVRELIQRRVEDCHIVCVCLRSRVPAQKINQLKKAE